MLQLKNFFTSGYVLDEVLEPDLKHRYQMTNIALILSSVAFFYGVIVNSIENKLDFMIIEEILIVMNVGLFFLLRANYPQCIRLNWLLLHFLNLKSFEPPKQHFFQFQKKALH